MSLTISDPSAATPLFDQIHQHIPGDGYLTMRLQHAQARGDALGVCVQGEIGLVMSLERTSSFEQADIIALTKDCLFAAVDGNCFGLSVGELFSLVEDADDSSNAMVGAVINKSGHAAMLSMKVVTPISYPEPKRRASLKRVQFGPQTLNLENSMRALVVWLDHLNSLHAPKYGTDKLVWCEEQTSPSWPE